MKEKSFILFIIVGILFGVLNTITVYSPFQSGVVAVLEAAIVLYYIITKKNRKGFYYFLLFTCLSIEQDAFIYGEYLSSEIERYYFFSMPLFRSYLFMALCLYYYIKFHKLHNKQRLEDYPLHFRKWLIILFVSGLLSIMVGMLLNDNGITSSGYYPRTAIQQVLGFFGLFFIIMAAIEITKNEKYREELSKASLLLLCAVVISAIITTFVFGVTGVYEKYDIMLTPISIALTPMLVLFFSKSHDSTYKVLSLSLGLLICFSTFFYPTCIGSKWYLVLLVAFLGWILLTVGAKSIVWIFFGGIIVIMLVAQFGETLLGSMNNDYVVYKLSQTLKLFNFFGTSSITDSFYELDNSTLYRFDEPANIFIEYTEKPLYALFGKGFGGTTLHHTPLLPWEFDKGSFSDAQIKIGAYYNMHETTAVLFLRHGILGICFLVYTIYMLVKKVAVTPWAMIALVWFVFYWSYGISSVIGAVAIVLALTAKDKETRLL